MSLERILSREVLHAAGRWVWSQLQGTSSESAAAPGTTHNPLENWTDHDLVRAASEGGEALAAVQLEMMRRLKNSLDGGHKSAAVLAHRIERLTVWLLWVAVVMGALAIVQALIALKVIG